MVHLIRQAMSQTTILMGAENSHTAVNYPDYKKEIVEDSTQFSEPSPLFCQRESHYRPGPIPDSR
jgi:hypothetical protein